MEVLRPVFEAEVLVLDDLGAVKPTGWVWDAVSIVLNTRYNDKRTTIITTNFEDGPAKGAVIAENQTAGSRDAQAAARKETLGDRIGERMRSRLFEMCRLVRVDLLNSRLAHPLRPKEHANGCVAEAARIFLTDHERENVHLMRIEMHQKTELGMQVDDCSRHPRVPG